MTWFAYAAEVRVDDQWAVAFMLVSRPGVGLRDMLSIVQEGMENEVRARRILNMEEFKLFIQHDVELHVEECYVGEEVTFQVGAAVIDPRWVGRETWDAA